MRYLALSLLLLDAAPAGAQIKPVKDPTSPQAFASYGVARPVPLSEIANNGEQYERVHVRTTGELRPLAMNRAFFILADGMARVLLIPSLDAHSADPFVGRPVELTGLVRQLPAHQSMVRCWGEVVPESKCLDPTLPPVPDARQDWPRFSITFFGMSDATPNAAKAEGPGGVRLAELITNPGPYAVKPVTVVGVFAGRNLFGDLPAGSQRTPTDWVLKQGTNAVWVTGKLPQGKGWRLDPDYRGDTVRWLQVTGRVEAAGGVTFLRASKVALTSAPKVPDEER